MKPLKVLKTALEKRCVTRALRKHDGCVTHAAEELHVHRFQLRRMIGRHGLWHLVKRHQGAPPLRGNEAWQQLGEGA